VLYTRNTIEHREGTLAAIVPAAVVINHRVDELGVRLHFDGDLADRVSGQILRTDAGESGNRLSDVIDVSGPTLGGRTFLQRLVSLAGAAGIALGVPLVILLIGLPVALAVRGVLEVVGWVLGVTPR
jgi:hypothetical protein